MEMAQVDKKEISFNKPFLSGDETKYIIEAVNSGKISGDGRFTQKCHRYFTERYGFKKVLLTTSCTDALEMAALLLDISEGDEIIAPSFTFVSSVNAFVLRGAKIRFVDSGPDNPNIDVGKIEEVITPRTRAIIPVHYGGVACDMEKILAIGKKHGIPIVEDAAQAIESYWNGKPLGSLGTFSAFSFHETKNIISGEGGMLCINDPRYTARAEVIREKGTNRSAFFRGEIDKYGWVDVGSSFLPSDIIAAFLYAQLENLEKIQSRRIGIWNLYFKRLEPLLKLGVKLPHLPAYATNNAHLFYVDCRSLAERSSLIQHLKRHRIDAVFHYQSLHKSPYFQGKHDHRELPYADHYSDCLVRLPMYYELTDPEVEYICETILRFFS
jgi:dTDP-4-amino-4,6-dideoxygalactose transaminase